MDINEENREGDIGKPLMGNKWVFPIQASSSGGIYFLVPLVFTQLIV